MTTKPIFSQRARTTTVAAVAVSEEQLAAARARQEQSTSLFRRAYRSLTRLLFG